MDPGDILPTVFRAAPEVVILWCLIRSIPVWRCYDRENR
jgi:hypothetical protein